MTTATESLLPPLPVELNLDEAIRYDTGRAQGSFVVSTPNGRHLRVSATGLYLLQSARDGVPVETVAATLREDGAHDWSAAEVMRAHERVAAQIDSIMARPVRTRAGMWAKLPLVPAPAVGAVSRRLTWMFHRTSVVIALVAATVILSAVYLDAHPHSIGIMSVIEAYGLFLLVLVVHEIGHAAAGARYKIPAGRVGVVMYVAWPALFNEVSQTWRLTRKQRVVVDVGGDYFQVLATAALGGVYLLTGSQPVLVAITFSLLGAVTNLNPFFRFDGYWLFGDALGVDNPHAEGARALRRIVRRQPLRRKAVERLLAAYLIFTAALWIVVAAWLFSGAYSTLTAWPGVVRELIDVHSITITGYVTLIKGIAVPVILVVLGSRLVKLARSARARRSATDPHINKGGEK